MNRRFKGFGNGRFRKRKRFGGLNGTNPTYPRLSQGIKTEVKCYDQSITIAQLRLPTINTISNIAKASVIDLPMTSVVDTGGINPCNWVIQGADVNNRVGSKVTMKSLSVNLTFSCVTSLGNSIRIMVVLDKQPNGLPLARAELFQVAGLATDFISPTNISWRGRFRVLRDEVHDFAESGSAPMVSQYTYKTYVKKIITTDYKSSTGFGQVGDLSTNAIYLLCFVETPGSVTELVVCQSGHVRLRYYDF
jgi:hypothetical protein